MEDLKWVCNLIIDFDLIVISLTILEHELEIKKDEFIILRRGSSATGNNSFSSLVGIGSNKHGVGLDAEECI